jgi:hypothetical protein
MPRFDHQWYQSELDAEDNMLLLERARRVLRIEMFDHNDTRTYLPLMMIQSECQRRGLAEEYEAVRQQVKKERAAWARQPFPEVKGR